MSAPLPSRNPAFKPVRLQHVMREVRRPVLVKTQTTYTEIGVRSHGRGIFHKEPITGELLGNKRVFWLKPGTLVFNIVFAWERAVAVLSDEEAGFIGSHRFPTYEMLPGRAHAGFMKHYFTTGYGHYLLQLNSPGAAGRNKTLSQSDLMKEEVWLPPADNQKTIADFLDRKTAAIDALIDKKRKLLDLLAEKRAALINQAVTKGLDPTVPMKDSGIPWIGEVPAHWEVMQLRRTLKGIEQGWSPQCEARPVSGDEWGVLKAGCTAGGIFRPFKHKALPADLEPRPHLRVRCGDLIMSRASGSPDIVGSAALVGPLHHRLLLSDKLFRLREDDGYVLPEFLVLALGSRSARSQIENAISGAEGLANNLPQARLKEVVVVCPPVKEQRTIATTVDNGLASSLRLADSLAASIERFQEYRQALITAAVTGQMEVAA